MMFSPSTASADFEGLGSRLVSLATTRSKASAIEGPDAQTHGRFASAVTAAAAALRRSGVQAGQRFAIVSRNSVTILELFFAASLSGTVIVTINHRLSPREVGFILDDAQPRLVFVEDDLAHLLTDAHDLPEAVTVHEQHYTAQYLEWRDAPSTAVHHVASPDDVVIQMYTTGTTGLPKGALLAERNLAAMARQLPHTFMVDDSTRYLGLLPMFHISGAGTAIGVALAGGCVVLPSGTSVDAVLRDLVRHQVTHVNLVPSLMGMLTKHPDTVAADLQSLQVVMYGAAPSAGTVVEDMMALVPQCTFVHGYGLTECTGGVAYVPPLRHGDPVSHRPGLVGRPPHGIDLRVVDPHTLLDVDPGQPGEIWVRSPGNVSGYWQRPDESAALYAETGWLRTGDIGQFEGEDLVLKDRLKDMIISGGENVYSAEVEHIVAMHPSIDEVAAVGVPHERWGEVVAVVVTALPGHTVSEPELIEFCRQRLAHFKCPKSVHVVEELPRTGNGKILKRTLRDTLVARAYNSHND